MPTPKFQCSTNAAEQVRLETEDNICSGKYLPGDSLDERALMEYFGVSRTPVREAILQLSAQGLVKIVPRSGTFVARMSIKELLAMFELLSELEGACAKLASRRMSAEERRKLVESLEESRACVAAHDAADYEKANSQFHELLYAGCLNKYLREQILTIRRRTQIYRQAHFHDPRRIEKSWNDHRRVVDAILAGDEDGACRAMIEHIAIGGQEFAEFIAHVPNRLLEP